MCTCGGWGKEIQGVLGIWRVEIVSAKFEELDHLMLGFSHTRFCRNAVSVG